MKTLRQYQWASNINLQSTFLNSIAATQKINSKYIPRNKEVWNKIHKKSLPKKLAIKQIKFMKKTRSHHRSSQKSRHNLRANNEMGKYGYN